MADAGPFRVWVLQGSKGPRLSSCELQSGSRAILGVDIGFYIGVVLWVPLSSSVCFELSEYRRTCSTCALGLTSGNAGAQKFPAASVLQLLEPALLSHGMLS